MTDLENVRCPLCGEDKIELLMEVKNTHGSHRLSEEEFNLVKCRVCGLVSINPRPAQGEIEEYYEKDYYIPAGCFKRALEKAIAPVFISHQKRLVTGYKKAGKLLDIGCGGGDFLSSLDSNSFDLYGVKPNKGCFSLCRLPI